MQWPYNPAEDNKVERCGYIRSALVFCRGETSSSE